MKREEIADLMAFVVVAESEHHAAARLSMAQSALSQIVSGRRTIGIAASDANHAQRCSN